MTLQQFIEEYDGKGIDWDGSYGNQCMDLMAQYVNEVLGIEGNPLGAPTAYQSFVTGNHHFDKFTYAYSGSRPQAGDIVYWDTTVGEAGHVAICISAGSTALTTFDQNWPIGSLCHEQPHDYTGVAGWLRLKTNDTPMTEEEKTDFELLEKTVTENRNDIKALRDDIAYIKQKLDKKIGKQAAVDQIKSRTKPARSVLAKLAKKLGVKYNPKVKK